MLTNPFPLDYRVLRSFFLPLYLNSCNSKKKQRKVTFRKCAFQVSFDLNYRDSSFFVLSLYKRYNNPGILKREHIFTVSVFRRTEAQLGPRVRYC
jgi:hypothetical protein